MSAARPMTRAEENRLRRLPEMLDLARRKVAALENEARRHGLRDLLPNELN